MLTSTSSIATLDCGHTASPHSEHTTGTCHTKAGLEICWDCAALGDTGRMLKDGNSNRLPLYLNGKGEVINWPGTLRFKVFNIRMGRHNIGRTRTDVWFVGPDSYVWHGVQIGDWNEVCHAKRTKQVRP